MIGHRFPPLLPVGDLLRGRCLVIAPHADDEVIGCGGTLVLARRAGHAVRVLHLTDGADGDPDGRYGDIVAVRRDEARLALAALGVDPAAELALRDGTLGEQLDRLTAAIADQIRDFRPLHLLAPSPFEAHPDHRAASEAVRRALGEGDAAAVESVLLYGVNSPVPATALIDITAVAGIKDRAMASYASQIEYNDIRAKVRALDAARTVNVDLPAVAACEAFTRLPRAGVERLHQLAAELDREIFPAEVS